MRVALLVAFSALLASLAGCAAPASEPTPATGPTATPATTAAPPAPTRSPERARAALAMALDALYSSEGVFASLPNVKGYDMAGRAKDPGGKVLSVASTMRFGFDDTSELRTKVGDAETVVTCGPEGYVVEGGPVTELRRRVPGVTCAGGGGRVSGGPPRNVTDYGTPSVERATAVPGADAQLRYTFQGGAALLLTLDASDLLLALDVGTLDNGAFYRILYGARDAIPLPVWDARASATVKRDEAFRPGELSWLLTVSEERPLRSDLEVRVTSTRDGAEWARFRLDAEGDVTSGNVTFRFDDRDRDGRASAGDLATITSPYWIERADFEATLHDLWAGAMVRH